MTSQLNILPHVVDFGFAVGSALCGLTVLRVPWNLFFEARGIRIAAENSYKQSLEHRLQEWKLKQQQKGEEEREPTEEELKKAEEEDLKFYEKQNEINKLLHPHARIPTPPTLDNLKELRGFEKQRRLLTTAIGAHFVSAALSYSFAHYTGEKYIKKSLSYFFLASVVLRPLTSMPGHIRKILSDFKEKNLFPQDNGGLDELNKQQGTLTKKCEKLENDITETQESHNKHVSGEYEKTRNQANKLKNEIQGCLGAVKSNDSDNQRSSSNLTKKIQDSFKELQSNAKMIGAVKMFLKFLKE